MHILLHNVVGMYTNALEGLKQSKTCVKCKGIRDAEVLCLFYSAKLHPLTLSHFLSLPFFLISFLLHSLLLLLLLPFLLLPGGSRS